MTPEDVEAAIDEAVSYLKQQHASMAREGSLRLHEKLSYLSAKSAFETMTGESGEAKDAIAADMAVRLASPRNRPKGKRGPNPLDLWGRNAAIQRTIMLMIGRGFKPTRNVATPEVESACSIVVEALSRIDIKLSEGQVQDIWKPRCRPRKRSGK